MKRTKLGLPLNCIDCNNSQQSSRNGRKSLREDPCFKLRVQALVFESSMSKVPG
jgi:hypothetical protein